MIYSEDEGTGRKTIITYKYKVECYYNYINFYNLHKSSCGTEKPFAEMLSEKITLCEINACLWIKALNSAINSVTKHTYPHYIIVQKFINYILNTDSNKNFGLIENFFWKLLLTHPPSPEVVDYYWQILSGNFVHLNNKETEDQPLLFCLIDAVINCLKVDANADGNNDFSKPVTKPKLSSENLENFSSNIDLQIRSMELNEGFISKKPSKVKTKEFYFGNLPWKEKVDRCLIVLNFVYNVLETDFIFWLHSKEFQPRINDSRPLISSLLWKNSRTIGSLNKEVQKLFYLYELAVNLDFPNVRVIDKFVTLIGEIIRCSESKEIIYPFVGTNSVNFSRELSFILHQRLNGNKSSLKEDKLIVNFKPPWLRLFLCSHLLTLITGRECLPELRGVCDILEYFGRTENIYQNQRKNLIKSSTANALSLNREKFKNVNAKLRNGKTVLHVACENNDVEKIKVLLTFPELDVNAVDRNGWTALHIAANKGKTFCVHELLSFCPHSGGSPKPANTRARGPGSTTPLMCAASQGHHKICKLLLEHSGPVLLEDVNELNQTAIELANVPKIKKTLQHYKSNREWSQQNFKNVHIDLEFKTVVMKLCVEMIQAYFSTYRIWDICRTLKQSEETAKTNSFAFDFEFSDKDIKENICKLESVLPKLESVKEFKSLSYIYERIFSFNHNRG